MAPGRPQMRLNIRVASGSADHATPLRGEARRENRTQKEKLWRRRVCDRLLVMRKPKDREAFFIPALLLFASTTLQLILDLAKPIPLSVLNQYRSTMSAKGLGVVIFILAFIGLLAFTWAVIKKVLKERRTTTTT